MKRRSLTAAHAARKVARRIARARLREWITAWARSLDLTPEEFVTRQMAILRGEDRKTDAA